MTKKVAYSRRNKPNKRVLSDEEKSLNEKAIRNWLRDWEKINNIELEQKIGYERPTKKLKPTKPKRAFSASSKYSKIKRRR